ncbi:hypothetical protein DM01DRAFT_1333733 [Hesseltinella vesiculosa]|uniref:HSF-type DNA-binding domain-containing protein n=1 Tax=Hesseltinella vesiculosa TaxID=101127 RepID=A0A1X2GNQ1_9FUNG|nr:hypothetical protein DM01DRAFT_1333733 [Hesseltinella vesiculosa]
MASHQPLALTKQPSSDQDLESGPEFVKKLFRMLENNAFPTILRWGIQGKTFVVLEPNEFAKLILPKHFKHSNFASFVRQLNKYDFHKIRHQPDAKNFYGPQAWEFEHSHFQYNRRDLLPGIKRKLTKSQAKISQHGQLMKSFKSSPPSTTPLPTTNTVEVQTLERQIKDLQSSQKKLTSQLDAMSQHHHSMVSTLSAFQNAMVSQDTYIRKWLHQSLVSAEDQGSHDHIQQMLYTFEQMSKRAQTKLTHMSTNINRQMIPPQGPMLVPPRLTIPSDSLLQSQPWSIRPKVRLMILEEKDGLLVNWLHSFGCVTILDPTLQHHQPVDLNIVDNDLANASILNFMNGEPTPIVSLCNSTEAGTSTPPGSVVPQGGRRDLLIRPFEQATVYNLILRHCSHLKCP